MVNNMLEFVGSSVMPADPFVKFKIEASKGSAILKLRLIVDIGSP